MMVGGEGKLAGYGSVGLKIGGSNRDVDVDIEDIIRFVFSTSVLIIEYLIRALRFMKPPQR
jgi:hypothetical protein